MKKKLLHLMIEAPGYSSKAMSVGFIKSGFDYESISWQHLRFNLGLEGMRKTLIDRARKSKPDIIFCHIQNQDALDMETWEELSKICFVINYTFDVRLANEINWMYDVAKVVGYTFFATSVDVVNCKRIGIDNVGHIHSSCDTDLYKWNGSNLKAFDIVFCGNRYDNTNLNFPMASQRQEMVELINSKYPSQSMIYGLGQRGGMIYPDVEANVYNFARIGINQNNFVLPHYCSDRLWRIMASGCFCLTSYFPGIETIFTKGEHLDWWESFNDLENLITLYLENKDLREKVARAGTELVRSNHRWVDRINSMIQTCKL